LRSAPHHHGFIPWFHESYLLEPEADLTCRRADVANGFHRHLSFSRAAGWSFSKVCLSRRDARAHCTSLPRGSQRPYKQRESSTEHSSSAFFRHSLASHAAAGNINLALIRQVVGRRLMSWAMQHVGTSDIQAVEAERMTLYWARLRPSHEKTPLRDTARSRSRHFTPASSSLLIRWNVRLARHGPGRKPKVARGAA
jgi:hypothetical protein